jgi:tripartite-type tricarboxylate transporter receptor subunit TctC
MKRLKMTMTIAFASFMAIACHAEAQTSSAAQNYPVKPVRLVIPFPAGGGADIFARLIGRKLQDNLGQTFVADNRAGAAGIIGCEMVANASPDGYTLLMGTTGTHSTNPAVYEKLPYHPLHDFAPISLVAESPFVLLAYPGLPVKTVQELIAYAKTRPGQITYGSSGLGSSSHLGFELFNLMAGIRGVHVPYKGLPPAMTDAISGQVMITWNSISASAPFIKSGQIRALGIGSLKRSGLMPDIPAIAETLPGYELGSWYGLFAPARTPSALVRRLHAEIVKVITDATIQQQFAGLGAEPVGSTPDAFRSVLEKDLVKWAKVAREAKVKVE